MSKIIINLTLLTSIFLTIICIFPQQSNAFPTFGETTCQTCHLTDVYNQSEGELHSNHSANACTSCHAVFGDTPLTSKCASCHPIGNPDAQAIADDHELNQGQTCLVCHVPPTPTVVVTEDQTISDQFARHTVTGITTPLPELPDVPGFKGVSYLTIEDIDGDGIKEIIGTSGVGEDMNSFTANGEVAIFTWDGVDMDSWTQTIIYDQLAFPNETVVRDMDNDGDKDIMVMDNFIAGEYTGQPAGIYYLENLAQDLGGDDDITEPLNWRLQTIFQGDASTSEGKSSYHRAVFMDVDGDGLEDFVTSKISMGLWGTEPFTAQYAWAEWYKKEEPADNGTKYTGPIQFGDAGGFMFDMVDIDSDGDKDFVASQFFITESGSLVVKGGPDGSDPRGDSLVWLENPGTASLSLDPTQQWNRTTIDNWYTSSNPLGKGIEVIASDIDNDGVDELVYATHNHQDYKNGDRIWPGGIFYFEIPADPSDPSAWTPITIDAGDPNLDPDNATAVANDPFADDLGDAYQSGTPGMVRANDISGDGYPDIVLPGDGKGALYYYQSEGTNGNALEYSRATLYEDPACMPGDAQIVDIDGDGDKEIISVIWDTGVDKSTRSSSSIFIFEQKICSEPFSDVDSDGVCDEFDSCPDTANPNQEDADEDGIGDVCDSDTIFGTISGADQTSITVGLYQPSCGAPVLLYTTTTSSGYYAFGNLSSGYYNIIPDDINYTFVPNRDLAVIPQAENESYNFTAISNP